MSSTDQTEIAIAATAAPDLKQDAAAAAAAAAKNVAQQQNSKFSSININNQFKGKSIEPQQKSVGK